MSTAAPAIPGQTETEARLERGWGTDLAGRALFWIAVAFALFQLVTAAYSPIASQVVRSVHVGFLTLMVFGLAATLAKSRIVALLLWLAGGISLLLSLYHWVFYKELIIRAGDPTRLDIAVGVIVVLLVFEAARRMMGPALPIICSLFLSYGLFGQYLPSPLNHRGYDFNQIVEQMFLGTEGIYGIPTYVSSSFIFLFILFGAFLEKAGMINLFNDLALGTVGHARGGPAKVAVISSGLMGTINGSGVANVVTTGQFTIPLMKKFGYRPAFAGAVEATASMGGQIMPPVMGAVAFIMAETLDVSYATVCFAAIVPAILYYFAAFWAVHLEAGRYNLIGLPKAECPDAGAALRRDWYLLLPLFALVYLLFAGYTPLFAGTVGLGLTVMVILGHPIAGMIGVAPLRVLFWLAIGASAALFLKFGINALVAAIALLMAIAVITKGGRETLRICLESLADGARHALPVGIACALVGTIIGTLTLTGSATIFGQAIISIGRESLFLALLLTALTSLVLGMGIPTIPNYIITSSIAAPVILQLLKMHMAVPVDAEGEKMLLLVAHMFVFYFGIMADLTPPVALAAFAAAPIAQESGMKIGMNAVKIALPGWVVPFMAIYAPILMLQPIGPYSAAWGVVPAAIYVIGKAFLAVVLWGVAATGFFLRPAGPIERFIAFAAAALLVAEVPFTDALGFVACFGYIAWHVWRARAAKT